jgi:hypothetical protein
VPWTDRVEGSVTRAKRVAADRGRNAVVIVELPRAGESTVFDDDETVAVRIEEIVNEASTQPDVPVFLDGFIDHDRGYYPRHGLIDRAFNPRPALHRLIESSSR